MAVGTEVVAVRYEDIVAGTPISVPYPVYEALDIKVYYGLASLVAVHNTDYTITLGDDFDTFTLTPTTSLIDKINALIAIDPTEQNYITVRRELDYLTDSTAAAVRYTPFTSREFERTVLRFQQLQERLNRALVLSPNFVGDQPLLQLNEIQPRATLTVNEAGNAVEAGPTADEVENAQANAILAKKYANENEDVQVETGTYSAKHFMEKASDERVLAQQAREDAENIVINSQQKVYATRAEAQAVIPAQYPLVHLTDGQLYDRADVAPAHDGYYAVGTKFYVLRRSPAVYLEAFRHLLDLDGAGDSTPGYNAALAMLGAYGGGKLIFPREATIKGSFVLPAGNWGCEVDFNGCELSAMNGLDLIVRAEGALSGTSYQLNGNYNAGNAILICTTPVTDISSGDFILLQDLTARISDSATGINMEVHRVAGVSGSSIYLDEPTKWKKTAAVGNVRKLTMRQAVRLIGGRTRANAGAAGNGGVFARYCQDIEVDWLEHLDGVGTAVDFRSCYGVKARLGRAGPPQVIGSGQGYGLSFIQGTRYAEGEVYGEYQRHTLDLDSVYDVKAKVRSVAEQGSVVLTHNGAGGDIDLEVDISGCVTDSAVSATGWSDITGDGSLKEDGLDNVRVRGTVRQLIGAANNYSIIFNSRVRNLDVDIIAVNGSGANYDTTIGTSAALRVYGQGNTGRARIHARGYKTAFFQYVATQIATGTNREIELDIDVDWAQNGTYHGFCEGVNIKRFRGGNNISDAYHYIYTGTTSILRSLRIDDAEYTSTDITKYISSASGFAGVTDATRGHFGVLNAPFASKAVNGGFTITKADMLVYGKIIQLALSGASTLTGIDDGFFEGQVIMLQRRGSGTLTLNDIAGQLTLKTSPSTATNTYMLVWQGGVWWQI